MRAYCQKQLKRGKKSGGDSEAGRSNELTDLLVVKPPPPLLRTAVLTGQPANAGGGLGGAGTGRTATSPITSFAGVFHLKLPP
jgi:hypothetical protein